MGIERMPYWAWLPVGLIVGALFASVYTEQPSDSVERILVDKSAGQQDWQGGLLYRLTREWSDGKGNKYPYIKNLRILPPIVGQDGILVQEATFDFLKPGDARATRREWVPGRAREHLPFPEKIGLLVTGNTQAFDAIGKMLLDPHKKHRQPIEAKTLEDAQRALRRKQVDFVVCDMTIADKDVARPLADSLARMNSRPPMIILAESSEEPAVKEMVKLGEKQGIVGYVLRGDKNEWASAVEKLASRDDKAIAQGQAEMARLQEGLKRGVSPLIDKAFPDQTLRGEVERLKIQQAKDSKAVQVNYRYVWWAEKRARFAVWMTAGALVIGVIWPLVLWLLVGAGFGRAPEPAQETRQYSSAPEPPKPVKVGMTDEDQQKLLEMEAAMEAKLAAGGIAMTEAPASEHEELTEAQIKVLAAGPLEAPKEEKKEEKKEYSGQYYPTATHVVKKET